MLRQVWSRIPSPYDGKGFTLRNVLVFLAIFIVLCYIMVWSGSVTPVAHSSGWDSGEYMLDFGNNIEEDTQWEELAYRADCSEAPWLCQLFEVAYQQPEPEPYYESAPDPQYSEGSDGIQHERCWYVWNEGAEDTEGGC